MDNKFNSMLQEFLKNNKDYVTKFYDIGDGLSVSFKKNNEK